MSNKTITSLNYYSLISTSIVLFIIMLALNSKINALEESISVNPEDSITETDAKSERINSAEGVSAEDLDELPTT